MTEMITILGPTACGKTTLAANLAYKLGTEIISADSRQIYRSMDIGTGKDLKDYEVCGKHIPYHLIDIVDAGYKYNLFEYQRDFLKSYEDIKSRGLMPILCGGTGLYIESVLNAYRLTPVPENPELRQKLEGKPLEELIEILKGYKTLHNVSDLDTTKRAIRAIEIADHYKNTEKEERKFPKIDSLVVGINIDREERRAKISKRLRDRLKEGLVEEVEGIMRNGVSAEDLVYYGLEYKFVTNYITGLISYEEMVETLEIAIHQFAKRQMTWFRGMEKRGIHINWIESTLSTEEKISAIEELLQKNN